MATQNISTSPGDSDNAEYGLEKVGNGIQEILDTVKPNAISKDDGTGVATSVEVDAVIKAIINEKKLPKNQKTYNSVLVTVAHLCQRGATSPKYAGSSMLSDYGIPIKTDELRSACKSAAGITVRKFARGIRKTIVMVAKAHQLEGNLAKRYKMENPSYDAQDLVWVSDFQTFSEDAEIPEQVKEWLLANYKSRFAK